MNDLLAYRSRIAARNSEDVQPFALSRIDPRRLLFVAKGPDKGDELRHSRPIARAEALRLRPVAERTGLVDKWARRVRRAGKVRLFRLWKIFGNKIRPDGVAELEDGLTRPLAERLAYLRRTRRL